MIQSSNTSNGEISAIVLFSWFAKIILMILFVQGVLEALHIILGR